MRRTQTFAQLFRVASCAAFVAAACSPKLIVEGQFAKALSANGDSFQSDDDPQLIQAATPFGLKVMESLLEDLPRDQPLLLSACSGFSGYGYAFVQEEADETTDVKLAAAGHERARKLFLRAHHYCLRALDVAHPGLADALLSGNTDRRNAALAQATPQDAALLYWSAASWSLLISRSLDSMELIGQLPAAAALAERGRELDPGWNQGDFYDFFVSLDAARGVAQGGGPAKAKADLDRSLELSGGTRLSPLLSYAEGVLVDAQDRKGFVELLDRVLRYDVDQPAARSNRLANILTQRRARWLKSRLDDLFL